MDKVGDLIAGRYELLERAGEGGMAVVWRAVTRGAEGFARPVAVKRIHDNLARDEKFVRMFIEEARVGSQLHHANVVQLHDFGCDARGYFLVMEWLDGLHLGQWVEAFKRRGFRTPWRLVVAAATEVLAALQCAHTHETEDDVRCAVLHRDVTPHNVLVTVHGSTKLADFGLARAMDRARTTNPETIKGKVAYLAPELTDGAEPSVQTDLYSLGVVLWEALAMQRLFDAESDVERFRKARRAEVPPLKTLRRDVPDDLLAILGMALDRQPERRFSSALAMHCALLRLLGEAPVTPSELGKSVRAARLTLGLSPRSLRPPPSKSSGISVIPPPPPVPRAVCESSVLELDIEVSTPIHASTWPRRRTGKK